MRWADKDGDGMVGKGMQEFSSMMQGVIRHHQDCDISTNVQFLY
jgi:hypothetical protein